MLHSAQGLSSEEVLESRRRHGSNTLTPPKRPSLWIKFLEKFKDPIIIILLVALLLSLGISCYHYFAEGHGLNVFLEPLGVLLAVLLATGVSFYFELMSEREFEALNQVNEDVYYKVYRDGILQEIIKADIVVGDVILLDAGEQVPADGILLEAVSLSIDESSLTGEPLVNKTTRTEDYEPEATYPSNQICRGTTVLDGHCRYTVTHIGDATEYGRVYEGAQIDASIKTPLDRQLEGLAHLITRVSYAIAGLTLIASIAYYVAEGHLASFQWSHALDFFLDKVMIAVTIIVVAVPEGLPMSVTLSLAYSMRSMMKTGNLVRRMHACETMGATTVICTDKTGTLTQNRMTIADTSLPEEPTRQTYTPLVMAVNSTAHLDCKDPASPRVLGNPTEGALLLWLSSQGIDYQAIREEYPVVDQLTFSTERKYMATTIKYKGRHLLLVKGAPEIIMSFSRLSPEETRRYHETLQSYQGRAYRTIGLAYKYLEADERAWQSGCLTTGDLEFLGVVGISDPVREDVPRAIESCRGAGIQIKIITGDTPGTAIEIARQIGLWDEHCDIERNLITGSAFAELSDEALRPRLGELLIMSRARPMDKERLVRLLQEAGEVVAVTGDGTNDAPALNRAHVGLSMGDGTSVAKEASDITILDNSFASITKAVMWGRSLHLNIQRFILFQMTINVAACLIVLIGAFLGTESPLTVTQMLWVNLIMDTFAALALASLPPSERVMRYKPRNQHESIISPTMGKLILGTGLSFVGIFFVLMQYFKHHVVETRSVSTITNIQWGDLWRTLFDFSASHEGFSIYELTIFFSAFVFLQFWNMLNAKAYNSGKSAFADLLHCKNFLGIALVILLGQVLITTVGGEMFRVTPLSGVTWFVLLALTSLVVIIGEIVRWIQRGSWRS